CSFQFLFGDGVARIDGGRALKFRKRAGQVTLLPQFLTRLDVYLARFETRLVQANAGVRAVRVLPQRRLIKMDCGIPVGKVLGLSTLFKVRFAVLGAACCEHPKSNCENEFTATAHAPLPNCSNASLGQSNTRLRTPASSRGLAVLHPPIAR